MVKQIMSSTYHDVLPSNKKEQTVGIHSLNGYQGNHTEFLKIKPQKVTYHVISFLEHSWNDNIIETESRFMVACC